MIKQAALIALALLASSAHAARPMAKVAAKGGAKETPIALPLELIIPERQRICTMNTASGLGYKLLRAGTGPTLANEPTARVGYIGYLTATGAVFDQNSSAELPVDGLIPGFTEGLKLMQKGSIYRFCIPAKIGYGDRATGPIPANADLVFQVEAIEFLK